MTKNHRCNTSRERFLIFCQILFKHHGGLAMLFEGRLFSSGIFPRQSSETSRLLLTNHPGPLLANQILPTSPLLVASQTKNANSLIIFLPPLQVLCRKDMMVLLDQQEIKHPFLISLSWSCKDSSFLYLLFPYVCGGELFSYLRRYFGVFGGILGILDIFWLFCFFAQRWTFLALNHVVLLGGDRVCP